MSSEVSAGVDPSSFEMFNNAADNNKGFILDVLEELLAPGSAVLEIGSGSGQHAVHFAAALKNIHWYPGDREPYFPALERNLATVSLPNLMPPRYLDVAEFNVQASFDAVFCANVFHIMPATLIPAMFDGVGSVLDKEGIFIVYGPFKYEGRFTTDSNHKFDDWLKSRDPQSGIRDLEVLQAEATRHGLLLVEDRPMPANNQLLVFRKFGPQ